MAASVVFPFTSNHSFLGGGTTPGNSTISSVQTNSVVNTVTQASAKSVRNGVVMFDDNHRPILTDSEMESIATLQRNRDLLDSTMDMSPEALAEKIKDPKTPADLRAMYENIRDDPLLKNILDIGIAGADGNGDDSHCGYDDLDGICEWPQIKKFNEDRAKDLTHAYFPSDSDSGNRRPRDITENDAKREIYRYSDYLPEDLDQNTLQSIVDGNSHIGKCPAQVIAAAQYYLDHPEKWKQMAPPDGQISRAGFLDNVSHTIYLDQSEQDAIKTLFRSGGGTNNKDYSRESLEALSKDSSASKEVREAAKKLCNDTVLFGMLDNGAKGHNPGKHNEVDDGYISADDADKFLGSLTTKNRKNPEQPKDTTSTDATKGGAKKPPQWALVLMDCGTKEVPEEKKTKGGNRILAALKAAWHGFVNGCKKALHAIVQVLEKIIEIPGLKQILGPIIEPVIAAIQMASTALDIIDAVVTGKDIKPALKDAGRKIMSSVAEIMHGVSMALSALVKIPLVGEIALAASMLAEVVGGGLDLASAAVDGMDMKQALIGFSLGLGAAALGGLTVPGAGSALTGTAKTTALDAVKTAEGSVAKLAGKTEAVASEVKIAGKEVKTAESAAEQSGKASKGKKGEKGEKDKLDEDDDIDAKDKKDTKDKKDEKDEKDEKDKKKKKKKKKKKDKDNDFDWQLFGADTKRNFGSSTTYLNNFEELIRLAGKAGSRTT